MQTYKLTASLYQDSCYRVWYVLCLQIPYVSDSKSLRGSAGLIMNHGLHVGNMAGRCGHGRPVHRRTVGID